MGGSRVGTGGPESPRPGKSQLAKVFLRSIGMTTLEKQLDHRADLHPRGRPKAYDDFTKKHIRTPSQTVYFGSVHVKC